MTDLRGYNSVIPTLQTTGGTNPGASTVPVLTGDAQFLQTEIDEIFPVRLGVNQSPLYQIQT